MINLRLNNEESKNLSEEEIEIAMARKLEILILPYLRRNINFFYAGGDLKGKAIIQFLRFVNHFAKW